MSSPNAASRTPAAKVLCVVVQQPLSGDTSGPTSSIKFSTVSYPHSHPIFTPTILEVLPPFSTNSGGIPLLMLPTAANPVFVAHASGDDISAEQIEVLWQFKLFAQGVRLDAISETARTDILTLGGTAAAPTRTVGNFTQKESFHGWEQEHFNRFLAEYAQAMYYKTEDTQKSINWKYLETPRWVSAKDIRGMAKYSATALDRSLEENISINKRRMIQNTGMKKLPPLRDPQSKAIVYRRDQTIEKRTSRLDSNVSKRPAPRSYYPYSSKRIGYHGEKGAGRREGRESRAQDYSTFSSTKSQLNQRTPITKPSTSLRETKGLGAAISKVVKPYHSISARFQDRKLLKQAEFPEPTRDFIAKKIEDKLLDPVEKEPILHILRTIAPTEFQQRRCGRLINWANASDRLYRGLAQYISDASKAGGRLPKPCAEQLTPEMVKFTRANILKLPAERQDEIAKITERSVPSVDALPGKLNVLQPEDLPVENQIMIHKYVKKHLPREKEEGGEDVDEDLW